MTLSDVFPPDLVAAKFAQPLDIEEHSLADVGELVRFHSATLIQLGLSVWHQIVTRQLFRVDPLAMAEHLDAGDPFLYRRIEEHLSISAVHELHHLEMRLRSPNAAGAPPCATVCLAKTYPNDMLLADVAFVNPHKRIPKHRQRFRYQEFEGLGLLPDLMRRVISRARRDRMDRLLLIAAAADLVPLFEKHGLSVDDSDMARACLKSGASIPMQLVIEER